MSEPKEAVVCTRRVSQAWPEPGLAARVVVNQGCVDTPSLPLPVSLPCTSLVGPLLSSEERLEEASMGLAGPREAGSGWCPVRG